MQYSLNEVTLLPSYFPTDIVSRTQINPFTKEGKLPIFVAPMTSILDETNYQLFIDSKVTPILPRNCIETRDQANIWHSYSLQEFEAIVDSPRDYNNYHILIDIANGHIKKLYELVKQAKKKWPSIVIMIGNIAHPALFIDCCNAGVDFVRVGIGGGSVCSTSVQCGIHTSHHWFITEVKKLNQYYQPNRTKLIADGGINTLDKAIKALGIGYDYVMMGKCFAQCEEACGETKEINCRKKYPQVAINSVSLDLERLKLSDSDDNPLEVKDIPGTGQLVRKYYGMASQQGQIDISGGCTKNPEGIETWVPVDNTLENFNTKFEAALRSTMSYVGAHNLDEFRTNTKYDIQSIEEFKSYYK